MRQGKVLINDIVAGILRETSEGYVFNYDEKYIVRENAMPVCLAMPLRTETYKSKTLFAFFDGLIPEGWLLNIAERNWKLNRHDRMGLLLACCRDCIGNVSVIPIEDNDNYE